MTAIETLDLPRDRALHRSIDWRGAFWVASGVPALVLFSIGGIAGTTGKVAFLIWIASMIMGFIQSFTYAEIAGLFPNKSGGASIYGAAAWIRYSKLVAPLSVWCNWFAWSPVLSLGCSIAAAYILNALAPIPPAELGPGARLGKGERQLPCRRQPPHRGMADGERRQDGERCDDRPTIRRRRRSDAPAIRNWTLFSHSLGPVSFSFNAAFFIGVALMLLTFAIQHRGILGTANVQKYIGLLVIIPMLIVGVVPILTGQINWSNYSPLVPLAARLRSGTRHMEHRRAGPSSSAACSSPHGRPTASRRPFATQANSRIPAPTRSRPSSIPVCFACCFFSLVPFTFQGVLGLEGMLATPIVDGSGVAEAMGRMVGGSGFITNLMVMLMILALLLSIMTAMAGSSRTLYQGSVDGWLPRYSTTSTSMARRRGRCGPTSVFNLSLGHCVC